MALHDRNMRFSRMLFPLSHTDNLICQVFIQCYTEISEALNEKKHDPRVSRTSASSQQETEADESDTCVSSGGCGECGTRIVTSRFVCEQQTYWRHGRVLVLSRGLAALTRIVVISMPHTMQQQSESELGVAIKAHPLDGTRAEWLRDGKPKKRN